MASPWLARSRSALLAGALVWTSSSQAAPPAGTAIDNRASAVFAGTTAALDSNLVRATVDAAAGLDLEADRALVAAPGATALALHTLTNTGNARDTFTVRYGDLAGDDYDFASLALVVDANGNGAQDAGEVVLPNGGTIDLDAGTAASFVLVAQVPATALGGQVGRVELSATASSSSATDTNTDAVTVATLVPPPTLGFFTDGSFAQTATESAAGSPFYVEGNAGSCNLDPAVAETLAMRLVSRATGDDEGYVAVETGLDTGVFRIVPDVPTADAAFAAVVAGNGTVETRGGDTVDATFTDCATGGPVTAAIAVTSTAPAGGELLIEKTSLRDSVELGELVDYQVRVRNTRALPIGPVAVQDQLPSGFRYESGSARLDGARIADPAGGAGPSLRFELGTLDGDTEVVLDYRVSVGPGAARGDGVNSAQAVAPGVSSNTSSARVRIVDGVFSDRGFVLGKVFADANGNRAQDPGEPGVPGVVVLLEDGTQARSDGAGKFSFYDVSPRSHVLKLDATTLPQGARLVPLNNRFARDPGSQFIDSKGGELQRGDFAIDASQPGVLERVRERQERAQRELAELDELLERDLERDDLEPTSRDLRTLPASGELRRSGDARFDPLAARDPSRDERGADSVPPPRARPATASLEQQVTSADPSVGFLDLADGAILPADQAPVRVKGRPGTDLQLYVNGRRIPADRVGQRSSTAKAQAWEYVGVRLDTGVNRLEVREVDAGGNPRGVASIEVKTPGELARLRVEVPETASEADGRTPVAVTVFAEDRAGVPVPARTPITLETDRGELRGRDLDPGERGLQLLAESGRARATLTPPPEPGDVVLRATSGPLEVERVVSFRPHLRPLVAVGLVDAVVDWSRLGKGGLAPAAAADGFEEQIQEILVGGEDGPVRAGTRGALFLKGKILGETLLTLRYDSEKDRYDPLFRDIQPDRFYPVYGDSATRGFDAQSTSRLYVRVDRGDSYLLYGDMLTGDHDDAVRLGAYRRGITGARGHFERGGIELDGFVSHDDDAQVVEEMRGRGIAGPYDLRSETIENSEQVEILVRDRDQPSVVLDARPMTRFRDYEIDALAGTLLFREPIPSFDRDLNPMSIRVSYEVEQGGDSFWLAGVGATWRPIESLRIGASYVEDRNPSDPFELLASHFVWDVGDSTRVVAELAQAQRDGEAGLAARVDVRHSGPRLDAWGYWADSEPGFDNPNSYYLKGRSEAGLKASYRISDGTRLVAHALQSEDEYVGGRRRGGELYVDQAIGRWLRAELGVRHVNDTDMPVGFDTAFEPALDPERTSLRYTSGRLKLSAPLPWWPRLSAFGEYEQDVSDPGARVLAAGGELEVGDRTRLYARHEFISSLGSRYALDPDQEQHVTLFGIETDYFRNTNAFSEYRVNDVIAGRDAEAAIGLRNRWRIAPGLSINTAVERVQSFVDDGMLEADDATAMSVGLAYTRDPRFKTTGRVEYRIGERQNAFLSTFGLAAKIDEQWSFLGRTLVYQNGAGLRSRGDDRVGRLQLGVARRSAETNRWNALGRYELRYEEDEPDGDDEGSSQRLVHVVSTHLDYQLRPGLRANGRVAAKWAQELEGYSDDPVFGQLVAGRVTYDVTDRWDVGLLASSYSAGSFGSLQYGLGTEVGYLLTKNLWASAGYNFFGFEDDDLTDGEYTKPGVYFRLRLKFDEDMFKWLRD